MRHDRCLGFDDLEARKLMTRTHLGGHHAAAVPLVLDGTLTTNQKAANSTDDGIGDVIRSVPVAGVLAGVGKVHGLWTEGLNAYGTPLALDTIQLHGAQGSFTVSFDTTNLGTAHATALGASFNKLPQHVTSGSGGDARASETGTIVVNTNATKTAVESMTLTTANP